MVPFAQHSVTAGRITRGSGVWLRATVADRTGEDVSYSLASSQHAPVANDGTLHLPVAVQAPGPE